MEEEGLLLSDQASFSFYAVVSNEGLAEALSLGSLGGLRGGFIPPHCPQKFGLGKCGEVVVSLCPCSSAETGWPVQEHSSQGHNS